MAFTTQAFSVIWTIFMIWMLVDCIRNRSVRNKAAWILFILFTQGIGAAVYFFVSGPWPKVKQYLFPQGSASSDPTPAPKPEQEVLPDYARGYQAPASFAQGQEREQEYTQAPEVPALQTEYEQPLSTYPEMPPPIRQ
ncbi:MAG: PLDc_N domain-containing protein [Ktedonobacteraceae bacterium]|nr:PLDc_N domain-containing protein [Ktedonobacteraceae bacterium]